MYKKTVTYTDYNGVERTVDFYFNLTKSELMEMQLSTSGGLDETLKAIIKAKDIPALVKIFKELVIKAYGEKSPDGKRFIKSPEISAAFQQTEAYSDIFMELATNDKAASDFVNGIVPAESRREMNKQEMEEFVRNM